MENITLADIKNILVLISTIITAGGVISAFVYKLFKNALKTELAPFNVRIDETISNNNKRFEEVLKLIEELSQTTDKNDIDAVRSRIVAFDNLCRLNHDHKQIKKHQYATAFKDIDKWAMYHEKYPKLNGEINVAIENIKEDYKEAIFE